MGLKRTVAPSALAVSVEEAKEQIRLLNSDHDAPIERLIKAATEAVERYTGRALITQTWRLALDEFPCRYLNTQQRNHYQYPTNEIRLPRPPLLAITSIVYVDQDGNDQTISNTLYNATADLEPARVEPAYGQVWPVARCEREAVRVTYTAGYGADSSSVPEAIRHAILLMVAQWFAYREPVGDVQSFTVPMSAKWLLDSYTTGAGAEWYELAQ